MRLPSLTTLLDITIGNEIVGVNKWLSFVDGGDGFLYGIPFNARRVVKFNPLDKSLTEIGPDLGEGKCKWQCGVLANTGNIYCAPYAADHILKINPIQGTVETLDNVELPETGDGCLSWASGALAADNNIYYMPYQAHRIMRLNPDNDTLSSVGDNIGGGCRYIGTVVGNDDCLYGIPYHATHIIKFDLTNADTTSTVGEQAEKDFRCENGVLASDGYIYAANYVGQVLQIDTTNSDYTWIGDRIYSERRGWGDAIVGADKCIYWPPITSNRVLKFDPETQQLPLLVGGEMEDHGEKGHTYQGGALASDGVIYCIPCSATQVLAIDPLKELSMTLQNNFRKHPQELGRLFLKDEECNETFYDSAVRKFGIDEVFELIEECLPTDEEWVDAHSNALPQFMVAASCENCAASVIYYFLRRNVHAMLANYHSDEDSNIIQNKKRKLGGN